MLSVPDYISAHEIFRMLSHQSIETCNNSFSTLSESQQLIITKMYKDVMMIDEESNSNNTFKYRRVNDNSTNSQELLHQI
jgi:hypothetical protein